jgi:hypothetical protein
MASRFFSFLALSLSKGLFFVFSLAGTAQETVNLVPNPSFEEFENGCPVNGQDFPLYWSSWRGSPDVFSACPLPETFQDSLFWVPWNGMGYRWPVDGSSYYGFGACPTPAGAPFNDPREYLGCELIAPLVIGETYFIRLYVSTGIAGYHFEFNHACSHIGVIFTHQSYHKIDNPMLIPNFAHLYTEVVVSDTANWVSISGSFIADQDYTHMAIGVFFEFDSLNVVQLLPGTGLGAYYYVDNVCVSPFPDCIDVSVNDETQSDIGFFVYPNPASQMISVQSQWTIESIRLVNMNGIEVLKYTPFLSNFELNISSIATGIYFIETKTIDNKIKREKLLIVH